MLLGICTKIIGYFSFVVGATHLHPQYAVE